MDRFAIQRHAGHEGLTATAKSSVRPLPRALGAAAALSLIFAPISIAAKGVHGHPYKLSPDQVVINAIPHGKPSKIGFGTVAKDPQSVSSEAGIDLTFGLATVVSGLALANLLASVRRRHGQGGRKDVNRPRIS